MPLSFKRLTAIFKHIDPGVLAAAIVPLIAILPTFNGDTIPKSADGLFHIHRIEAMTVLLQDGDLYPRWIPWFHLGYGYPVFNFYSPAGTYMGGLLGLFGVSAPLAFTLVMATATVLGSLGMYALVRRHLSATVAITAAVIWVYAPSQIGEFWANGSISQALASGLTPWVLWAAIGVIERPNYRQSALFALSLGALILAHQPITFLLALFICPAILGFILWDARRDKQRLVSRVYYLGIGGLLGVGTALIFLLPMTLEVNHIVIHDKSANAASELATHFVRPEELFVQPPGLDRTDASWSIPRTFGLLPGILAVCGTIALLLSRRTSLAIALIGAMLFSLFLLTRISQEFWLTVPLMEQLRFPWRVFRVGVVFVAILGSASILLLPPRWHSAGAATVVTFIILAALPTIYPSPDKVDARDLSPADSIRWELETGSIGGTSYDEFKPRWGENIPTSAPENLDAIDAHPLRIEVIQPESVNAEITRLDDKSVRVVSSQPFTLQYRQFYFPGWAATVDGEQATIRPEPTYGLMTVDVPAGDHIVAVNYEGTLVQRIAPILSVLSVCIVGALGFRASPSLSKTHRDDDLSGRAALAFAIGIISFALVNTYGIAPHTTWFRHYSPPDNPTYMRTPVHKQFKAGYALLGYTLHQYTVQPDSELEITLYWRALSPTSSRYRANVQFINLQKTRTWGVSQPLFMGLSPREHTPDEFVSARYTLHLAPDMDAYVGQISIKLLDTRTNEWVELTDGTDTLLLDDIIRIEAKQPTIDHTLDYRIHDAIELRCAAIQSEGDAMIVKLYWHVINPIEQDDLRVFVHALDSQGNLIEQADAPPLSGDYPPHLWSRGQTLVDRYILPNLSAIQAIFVGMYGSDGTRLTITNGDERSPDDGILLSLDQQSCESS